MGGIPLPGELGEHARGILAGQVKPVPARDAATVALLREGSGAVEVYLLRRKASMAFAAGAYVFPGGSLDPRDADQAIAWSGPSPAAWGEVFRADERTARGLVCAAVRETFEESGVLLAGTPTGSVVADTTGDDWEADRLALIDRTLSFADFLGRRGLVLRSDLLRPWAHWITPEVESRRFDTRFFVAALPSGQRTRDVGGEADEVLWARPADVITRAAEGQIFLMPPTHRTLGELAAYEKVADVLATEREIVTFMPRIAEVDGEMRIVLDDGYRFGGV
ncbi:8-oxo-dGTP pyrophosphatase MutT (NUDIX family) [Streptosporangium becharense]|uniref:8-oxo-dGTP pyrophosphatase MutT (NUDIX family) n=1 Tax=Streptosporangium becharense TaxID=1816182 RepID=A0A7W9MH00_9ACTN|nr:NUDIX hydrolase [Streptosporangium becharense]MBB2908951.1 8-oxo-dGTP pyrophosphatase MutT (NUDIX family) [Streptosporangium becharense]MBB5820031.1 8-oxo-dGTP pyrophosphatase MutT (NUDIX family) [Streptosporangium becharense]